MVSHVALDFDGVIRHFDTGRIAAIEREHDLAPGTLLSQAFSPMFAEPALTGACTHDEWIERVGRAVGSVAAVRTWMNDRGEVDAAVLKLVDRLRSRDVPVVVLSNATDWFTKDLELFALLDGFDAVFNSSAIGYMKPDQMIYRHICEVLQLAPSDIFFVDDSRRNVDSAQAVGLRATRFEGAGLLEQQLAAYGLL